MPAAHPIAPAAPSPPAPHVPGGRPGQDPKDRDGGFATLELVILTPVLLAFVLLIVGFGRVTHGRQLVGQAAAAAARTASLTASPGQAQAAASSEAAATLAQAGISCRSQTTTVDTSDFRPGGQVTVRVTCQADLAGLTVVGFPGTLALTATAVAPLDAYRPYTGGPEGAGS